MTELSTEARTLIAQARTLDNPSAADRARMRQKLAQSWATQPGQTELTRDVAEHEALKLGNESSRWLWGTLTTAAFSVMIALWLVTRSASPLDHGTAPAGALDTVLERAAPASVATKPDATFAGDPEPVPPPAAAEPARKPSKPRAQPSTTRARRSAPITPTELALNSITEPEVAKGAEQPGPTMPLARAANPAPKAVPEDLAHGTGPTSAARDASAVSAAPTARTLSVSHETPPTRETATPVRSRVSGQSDAVRADDVAPPQSGPKFVAQPIDDELALLGAAQEALQNHQPSLALRLVQHHGFRFPRGALAQERIAVQTLALCALHRPAEARQVLAELVRRAPNSPLVAKLQSNCGFEANERR